MIKKNSKQRLFEVMERVAPNFTGKALNEEVSPEIQKKVTDLISDIETNYETKNSKTITDALFFDYGLKGQVEYNDLLNYVQQQQMVAKNASIEDDNYVQAGRNLNAPEDTGVGERPLTNQHGEYMGMYEDLQEQGPAPTQAGAPTTQTQQYGQQPDAQYADSTYKMIAPALKLINTPEKFAPAFKGWFQWLGYSPQLGNINIQRVRMDVENVLKQLGYK